LGLNKVVGIRQMPGGIEAAAYNMRLDKIPIKQTGQIHGLQVIKTWPKYDKILTGSQRIFRAYGSGLRPES